MMRCAMIFTVRMVAASVSGLLALVLFWVSPAFFLEIAPGITAVLAAVLICCAFMAAFRDDITRVLPVECAAALVLPAFLPSFVSPFLLALLFLVPVLNLAAVLRTPLPPGGVRALFSLLTLLTAVCAVFLAVLVWSADSTFIMVIAAFSLIMYFWVADLPVYALAFITSAGVMEGRPLRRGRLPRS
jgi:hypothetical protein